MFIPNADPDVFIFLSLSHFRLFIFMLDDEKTKQFCFQHRCCRFFRSLSLHPNRHSKTSVTAMTTDTRNCYLFTGSAEGFIKTWMIVNFWYVFNCALNLPLPGLVKSVCQRKRNQIRTLVMRFTYEGEKGWKMFIETSQVCSSMSKLRI